MMIKRILLTLFYLLIAAGLAIPNVQAEESTCGNLYTSYAAVERNCNCSNYELMTGALGEKVYCCGWEIDGECSAVEPTPILSPTPTPTDAQAIEIPEVTKETLDSFNPLKQFSSEPDRAELLSTPGGILSELLKFIFPIAGIILFIILLFAGIKIMTGAGNSQAVESGKQMIMSAVIGFVILFAAYWIAQLLQAIFGINILGN